MGRYRKIICRKRVPMGTELLFLPSYWISLHAFRVGS